MKNKNNKYSENNNNNNNNNMKFYQVRFARCEMFP